MFQISLINLPDVPMNILVGSSYKTLVLHTERGVLTWSSVLLLRWSWLTGEADGWQSSDTRSRHAAWHVYLQPADMRTFRRSSRCLWTWNKCTKEKAEERRCVSVTYMQINFWCGVFANEKPTTWKFWRREFPTRSSTCWSIMFYHLKKTLNMKLAEGNTTHVKIIWHNKKCWDINILLRKTSCRK